MAIQEVVSDGVVLRAVKYGESDRILTCFTQHHGRIGLFVKNGAKRAKQLGAAIEPISLSRFRYSERPNRDLCPLKGAETQHSFRHIRQSLTRIALASYWLDLVYQLTATGQAESTVFRLLVRALESLDASDSDDRWDLQLFFLVHLLRSLGFALVTDHCLTCGGELSPTTPVLFAPAKRGITACAACAPHAPIEEMAAVMRAVTHAEAGSLTNAMPLRPAERILRSVVHHLVGRPLKSEALLDQCLF